MESVQELTDVPNRVIENLKLLVETPLYEGKAVLVLGSPSHINTLFEDLEYYYTISNYDYAQANMTLSNNSFKEIDSLLIQLQRDEDLVKHMNQQSTLTVEIIRRFKEHLEKKYIEEEDNIDFTRQVGRADEIVIDSLTKLNPSLLNTINLTLIANAEQIEKLKELVQSFDSITFGVFRVNKQNKKIYLQGKELGLEVNQPPSQLLRRFITEQPILSIQQIHNMFFPNTEYRANKHQRDVVNERIKYLRDAFEKVSSKEMRELLKWRANLKSYELLPEI